jgi:hypothetical protein
MENFVRNFKLEDLPVENQKFVCKECCRETSHKIVASYYEKGSQDCGNGNTFDWSSRNQIIQCLGCEIGQLRRQSFGLLGLCLNPQMKKT